MIQIFLFILTWVVANLAFASQTDCTRNASIILGDHSLLSQDIMPFSLHQYDKPAHLFRPEKIDLSYIKDESERDFIQRMTVQAATNEPLVKLDYPINYLGFLSRYILKRKQEKIRFIYFYDDEVWLQNITQLIKSENPHLEIKIIDNDEAFKNFQLQPPAGEIALLQISYLQKLINELNSNTKHPFFKMPQIFVIASDKKKYLHHATQLSSIFFDYCIDYDLVRIFEFAQTTKPPRQQSKNNRYVVTNTKTLNQVYKLVLEDTFNFWINSNFIFPHSHFNDSILGKFNFKKEDEVNLLNLTHINYQYFSSPQFQRILQTYKNSKDKNKQLFYAMYTVHFGETDHALKVARSKTENSAKILLRDWGQKYHYLLPPISFWPKTINPDAADLSPIKTITLPLFYKILEIRKDVKSPFGQSLYDVLQIYEHYKEEISFIDFIEVYKYTYELMLEWNKDLFWGYFNAIKNINSRKINYIFQNKLYYDIFKMIIKNSSIRLPELMIDVFTRSILENIHLSRYYYTKFISFIEMLIQFYKETNEGKNIDPSFIKEIDNFLKSTKTIPRSDEIYQEISKRHNLSLSLNELILFFQQNNYHYLQEPDVQNEKVRNSKTLKREVTFGLSELIKFWKRNNNSLVNITNQNLFLAQALERITPKILKQDPIFIEVLRSLNLESSRFRPYSEAIEDFINVINQKLPKEQYICRESLYQYLIFLDSQNFSIKGNSAEKEQQKFIAIIERLRDENPYFQEELDRLNTFKTPQGKTFTTFVRSMLNENKKPKETGAEALLAHIKNQAKLFLEFFKAHNKFPSAESKNKSEVELNSLLTLWRNNDNLISEMKNIKLNYHQKKVTLYDVYKAERGIYLTQNAPYIDHELKAWIINYLRQESHSQTHFDYFKSKDYKPSHIADEAFWYYYKNPSFISNDQKNTYEQDLLKRISEQHLLSYNNNEHIEFIERIKFWDELFGSRLYTEITHYFSSKKDVKLRLSIRSNAMFLARNIGHINWNVRTSSHVKTTALEKEIRLIINKGRKNPQFHEELKKISLKHPNGQSLYEWFLLKIGQVEH